MVVKLTPAGRSTPLSGPCLSGPAVCSTLVVPTTPFFGVALSPDKSRVAVVGYLSRDTASSEKNDSAVLWLKP